MSRAMKRLAGQEGDLGLARRAKELYAQAISAIKKRQSVLIDQNPKTPQSSSTPTPPTVGTSESLKAPGRLPTPSEMTAMTDDALLRELDRLLAKKQAAGKLPPSGSSRTA
jgi:hypothetical protein